MSTITILANEPLNEQGLYSRDFIQNITANQQGYNHTI